uniref:Reverse transcriptase domain-containing protein n=1 Tax=Aegilops tauschii subsp. strangulata TaxID=200361 RepID=A0A452YJN5_AEGTS
LPARKAPGPDGFTAEFLRACWSIIKQDFFDVFQQLFELRGRGLSKLNQALLTLLPKRADACQLRDYRTICLIHLVAKIFAKVLSLRLAPRLGDMVSRNQNAFIPGRSLHDNFVLVKQSMKLLHQLGAPRVMLKLDLTRAFDSLSWPFLFEALGQYGFGPRFREWLAILLSSSSTRIVLGRLISRAHDAGILQRLHPRRDIPAISLYADDVMLFCHATHGDVEAVCAILALFSEASGLRVNYAKSSATTLNGDPEADATIDQVGCAKAGLPITYLGILLTLRRPSAAQLQPLV